MIDITQTDKEHAQKYNHTVFLENIRMLYGFMEELEYQLKYSNSPDDTFEDKHYDGIGGLQARASILEKMEEQLTDEFLKKSEFKKYCDFWQLYFGHSPIRDSSRGNTPETLSRMFHFYHTAHDLQSEEPEHDTLPYRYEDICITIAEMTGYDMCHILYKNGDTGDLQTVSQSGVLFESNKLKYAYGNNVKLPVESEEKPEDRSTVLDIGFQNEAFKNIINQVDNLVNINEWEEKEVIIPNAVFTSKLLRGCSAICLRIPLKLNGLETHTEERRFYVLLTKWDQQGTPRNDEAFVTEATAVASQVLFMRDTLSEILCRDYATLLNFRYNCEYIQSVDPNFNNKNGFPLILHISDLHIDEVKKTIWVEQEDVLKESKKPIDLLAITGDIVQGSKDAPASQKKYENAADYITQWAILLWGVNGRLPHDWRRRIMITTGNHDYMTMNELMSSTEDRETKSGTPSKGSGGTMVKFTYFIEILQQWLDAPTSRLIKHDLNEYRYYKNLNLRVLILNSVSEANVYQNNKVSIDKDKALDLAKIIFAPGSDAHKVCLLHHSPKYEIDYLADAYKLYEHMENEFAIKAFLAFEKIFDTVEIMNFPKCKDQKIKFFQQHYQELLGYIQRENADITEKLRKSKLFETLKRVSDELDMVKRGGSEPGSEPYFGSNDFLYKEIHEFNRWHKTQQEDQAKFKWIIQEITNSAKEEIVFLAGHVHHCGSKYYDNADKPPFVVGQAERCFSIIEDKTSRTVKYQTDTLNKEKSYCESERTYLKLRAQIKDEFDKFEKNHNCPLNFNL